MRLGDRLIDLFPGCVLCLRPDQEYCATQDRKRRLGNTFVHFNFLDRSGKVAIPNDLPPDFVVLREIEFYDRLTRRIVELMESKNPECQPEADHLLLAALHAVRFRAGQSVLDDTQRERSEAINATQRFIRDNPGKFFSVAELADRVGYCPNYLTRLFRKIVGMTPKEFCIRVRLEHAQTLLSQSRMGIEQIATALGYSDVFFFSRQFKQRIGLSPATWRARGEHKSI
jgi:AraC-like DNA-binding protein